MGNKLFARTFLEEGPSDYTHDVYSLPPLKELKRPWNNPMYYPRTGP